MRGPWAPLLVSVVVALAAAACTTDYQQGLDDPKYGGPNALSQQKAPGASDQETQASTSGGAASSTPLCVTNGGTISPPKADCAVTFTQILAAFTTAKCTTSACHGAGTTQPLISSDKAATYNALTQFKLSTGGKAYVNPCSTDTTLSAITFNIDPAAATSDRGSLMPASVGLAEQVANVKTWVGCGSPNN